MAISVTNTSSGAAESGPTCRSGMILTGEEAEMTEAERILQLHWGTHAVKEQRKKRDDREEHERLAEANRILQAHFEQERQRLRRLALPSAQASPPQPAEGCTERSQGDQKPSSSSLSSSSTRLHVDPTEEAQLRQLLKCQVMSVNSSSPLLMVCACYLNLVGGSGASAQP